MTLTYNYEECQLLAQWLNSLNFDVGKIPEYVKPLLERLTKVVESPKSL